MLLPRPTDWQIRGAQRLWSTGGKRSDFDAAAQKKVHILEARDRVLARLRDKKRDAAEAAKFKKKEKKTGAEGKATKPKDSKKSKSKSTDERSTAIAAGGVEVVGDGAPAERKRRVRQAAVVVTEPVELEEEDEAQELPPPMTLADVVQVLREEKGLNPMVLNVSQKCNFTHYMIIIEGRSGRHLRAMAERIMDEVHQHTPHTTHTTHTTSVRACL